MSLVPSHPFQIVGIDIYGPLPATQDEDVRQRGFRYIISIIDHFSRWIRLVAVREDPTAKIVAEAFATEWIRAFGVPGLLVTDQGSEFTSRLLQETGHLLGMRVHSVPTESQWRNGKAERVHLYLGHRMKIWRAEGATAWHLALPYVEMSHHFMSMPAFKKSPYEILFGVAPRLPFLNRANLHLGWGEARLLVADFRDRLQAVRNEVRKVERELAAASVAKRRARQNPDDFALGDKVFVFTRGTKNKVEYLWSDAVVIVGFPNDTTLEVEYPSSARVKVPRERAHRAPQPVDFSQVTDGPLSSGYPRSLLCAEPDRTSHDLDNLETYTVTIEKTVSTHHEGPSPPVEQCLLRFGDFIAHLSRDGSHWTVSQYLGYNGEHNTEEFPNEVCLRRLDRYRSSPPTGPWHYRWSAERGPDVLAGVNLGHNDPPSAKNTGELCSLWDYVPERNILAVISLKSNNCITSNSWRTLLRRTAERELPHNFLMSSSLPQQEEKDNDDREREQPRQPTGASKRRKQGTVGERAGRGGRKRRKARRRRRGNKHQGKPGGGE